jgi:hypothetical protein
VAGISVAGISVAGASVAAASVAGGCVAGGASVVEGAQAVNRITAILSSAKSFESDFIQISFFFKILISKLRNSDKSEGHSIKKGSTSFMIVSVMKSVLGLRRNSCSMH